MSTLRWTILIVLVGFLFGMGHAAHCSEPAIHPKTPLDDYIAKTDPSYSWKIVKTIPGDGHTTFVVDLKSQTWRSSPEVNRTVWQHWLVIVKPETVKHDTAFLRIGGGRNGNPAPNQANPTSVQYAKATHSVVADLGTVPNQPLIFNADGKERSEDDLIAYGHIKFMDIGDPLWLPRLPMVKSAVRAMDAVTEVLASVQGGKIPIRKFVVAGGSKRGWTTWLTGAVDKRVIAVVPIVIDVVNVRACKINHYSAYGFWAQAIGDYTKHKIHDRLDTPEYAKLLQIVDPYSYRERFTMPKFVVNSSGDQFFPPDSSKFYFHDLPGTKYLRYVPNTNHSLKDSDASGSILAFYLAILNGSAMPKFSWKVQEDGSIRVETPTKPLEANLWQATNSKARDFRLETIGAAYRKSTLPSQTDGVYVARVEKPPQGWTAFFVELVFDSGEKLPYKFTTQVHIVPDVLPHSIEEFRRTLGVAAGTPHEAAVQKDLAKLQGDWELVSALRDGKKAPPDEVKKTTIKFVGEIFEFPDASRVGTSKKGTIKIDPSKTPRWMDAVADKGEVSLGIYEIAGDDYKVCFAPPSKERPKKFSSKPGTSGIFQVWKRQKAGSLDAGNDDAGTKPVELLRSLNDAYLKRDQATMDRLMSEDHLAILSSGQRQNKAEHLKSLPDLKLSEYTMENVQVLTPGKDVAIITYAAKVKGSFKGETLPPKIMASSVWANRNGKWQEVLYQETVVK